MPNETMQWLFQKRYEDVVGHFMSAWGLYLQVYTTLLVVNIAALTWFFSKDNINPDNKLWISLAFIFQDILMAIQGVIMAKFTNRAIIDFQVTVKDLLSFVSNKNEVSDPNRLLTPTFPGEAFFYGGWATCAGVSILAIIWFYLGCL